MQGEKIPVELELLDVLHKKLHSIGIWKDELSQVFVDKSNKEILQVGICFLMRRRVNLFENKSAAFLGKRFQSDGSLLAFCCFHGCRKYWFLP